MFEFGDSVILQVTHICGNLRMKKGTKCNVIGRVYCDCVDDEVAQYIVQFPTGHGTVVLGRYLEKEKKND